MKPRPTLIVLAIMATLLLVYESSFRICVRRWGEIDTNTEPASLYFSSFLLDKPLRAIFAPRICLPFGKVYLGKGHQAYLTGGVFYLKREGGTVVNLTEGIQENRNRGEIEQPDGAVTQESAQSAAP